MKATPKAAGKRPQRDADDDDFFVGTVLDSPPSNKHQVGMTVHQMKEPISSRELQIHPQIQQDFTKLLLEALQSIA